ncbi:hypothetical protein BDV24DRAFT_159901 [Aspergillus arachidicola]|uniref:Uncharacterized protein n=1 Tax=Aspergillus arachidicola TaxID=656916 RepID=A0A5N6YKF6_9EURO|nr:hypothetical protein BDV24DRAFT_159901 [Aspergillus arachidicola]
MVKIILSALAILAAIAPLATAEKIKCNNATAYCGATLINRGGYLTEIREILKNHDEDPSGLLLQHGLFWCKEDGKLHDAYKRCKRNKCRANQRYYPETGDGCKGEWRGSILPDMNK